MIISLSLMVAISSVVSMWTLAAPEVAYSSLTAFLIADAPAFAAHALVADE